MANVSPLKPEDVAAARKAAMPDVIIMVFNTLITESFNGYNAIIKQDDVVRTLVERGLEKAEIYNRGWLDVEPIFEAAGWKVMYDKPAYYESYDAYFKFSVK